MTSPLHQRKGIAYRAYFRLDPVSGVFAVEFPDLPGCAGSGRDFVQARDRAKHVLDDWIDASLDRGEAVPVAMASREPQRPARAGVQEVWIQARSAFQRCRIAARRHRHAASSTAA